MKQIPIIVINLKQDVSKREIISKNLNLLGLEFSFFEAVNGKELTDREFNNVYNFKNSLIQKRKVLSRSEIGCALSHFEVYQKMIDNNVDKIILLEDDAIIGQDFIEALNIVSLLPKNWEIFLLGSNGGNIRVCNGYLNIKKNYSNFKVGIPLKVTHGTCGYIINRKGALRMLSYSKLLYLAIDQYTGDRSKMNTYAIYPRVVSINASLKSSIIKPQGSKPDLRHMPKWKQSKFYQSFRKLRRRIKKKRVFSFNCFFRKLFFLVKQVVKLSTTDKT
jgi:glycosyl transferase family 25